MSSGTAASRHVILPTRLRPVAVERDRAPPEHPQRRPKHCEPDGHLTASRCKAHSPGRSSTHRHARQPRDATRRDSGPARQRQPERSDDQVGRRRGSPDGVRHRTSSRAPVPRPGPHLHRGAGPELPFRSCHARTVTRLPLDPRPLAAAHRTPPSESPEARMAVLPEGPTHTYEQPSEERRRNQGGGPTPRTASSPTHGSQRPTVPESHVVCQARKAHAPAPPSASRS